MNKAYSIYKSILSTFLFINLSIHKIVFSLFAKRECRIQLISHIWTETCVLVKII